MSDDLYVWTCSCGSKQAMTREANTILRQSSTTFYCVHGHARHYPQGPSAEDKLKKELELERNARQRAEQAVAEKADEAKVAWNTATRERDRAEHERRRANGYKGHATRITKRAKAGVCPCCNRTFKHLAAHMANQHPEFTPLELENSSHG